MDGTKTAGITGWHVTGETFSLEELAANNRQGFT